MNPFGLKGVNERVHALLRLGTWIVRMPSSTIWWSDETYRIHEVELGTPISAEYSQSFFPPSALALLVANFERLGRDGGRFDVECAMTTAKGRSIQIRACAEAVDADGVRYLVGTFQDVSEAASLKNFLTSVIDNFPQMIFVKDPKELRFMIFNRAGEDLLGLKAADMLGKNDYDFFPPDQAQHFIEKDRQVLLERKILDIPDEPIDAPAGRRYLHTKKMPVFDPLGEPLFLLGISEDITERKKANELILKQQQALFNSAKMAALGEMASGVAHEVNNPLTVIQGYVYKARSLLAEVTAAGPVSTKMDEQLAGIDQTVARIATVIKGLRSFSRETRSDPLQAVGLGDLVEDTLALCRERFKTFGIDVRVAIEEKKLAVYCRQHEVTQALLHLLNNAFDALKGVQSAWIEVAAGYQRELDAIAITVTNNGPIIPPRIRPKIFQPFFTTKEAGKNIGLGLGLARGLAENHGGRLEIDESELQHTRFVMTLPVDGPG